MTISRFLSRALLLASLATLALAAPASATSTVKLSGGSTTLSLEPSTAAALQSLGVSAAPIDPASAGADGIAFPVTGGKLKLSTLRGHIAHSGGLSLTAGSTRVELTEFDIDLDSTPDLEVRANGRHLDAFDLDLGAATVTRDAVGAQASGVIVKLSREGAKALNRAFGVSAFSGGLTIGTATVKLSFAQIRFIDGATTLTLDPGTAAALTGLGVSLSPQGVATANEGGSISFPISGGRVDAATLAGAISHRGGITLRAGKVAVTVRRFVIDTTDATLTALIGDDRIELATLDLSGAAPVIDGQQVTVAGVPVALSATAAAALNQVFGTTALTAGLPLGTATIVGIAR